MRNDNVTVEQLSNGLEVVYMNVEDSTDIYAESSRVRTSTMPGNGNKKYVMWGADDQLPYKVMRMIGNDEVLSANKQFNVLTCYGSGIRFVDKDGLPSQDETVKAFARANAIPRFFLEQATDMKFFYFCVAVLILNRKGDKIVNIRHKEACYCRFEKADASGKINHVYFADFEDSSFTKDEYEEIRLLDEYNPIGDLRILMGKDSGLDGKKRIRTNERKFAVLCKFPTPGNRYYPTPYYASLFRGYWYDIKKLIGLGKKTKIKNHCGIRYLVEINNKYWSQIFDHEKITDEAKRLERIKTEKENINKFLAGIENNGKTLFSGYYVDPNGIEVQMIRIKVIDNSKEGGDWSEDIQEASNMLCYADNIHPNLIGATPGKGGQNNSGSDKRELFTLKQSLEIAYHDIMKMPLEVVADFNDWNVEIQIPMITLTTLDQHKDANEVTVR